MSVIEPEGRTMGPAPAAPARERDEAGRFAPTQAEEAEVPETPAEPETFDRAYVEQLRDEAARYRTRGRDYEQVFEGYDEETRAGWLELISMAKAAEDNPEIQQQLAQMLGFELQPSDVQAMEETIQEDRPLTREEMMQIARDEARSLYAEEQSARDEQNAIRDIQNNAKALGYDQESPDYVLLLKFANDMDVPDLEAADAKVKEYHHAKYEEFIQRKTSEASQSPVAPSGNGVSPSIVQTPKTWEAARDALHERLSNI